MKTRKLTLRSLSQEERQNLFSEYMHKIGQWKTINGQVTIVGEYIHGSIIVKGFKEFIKNYNQ